jgi:hypothetical protein
MGLEHLFDAELHFSPGMDPVVAPAGRDGQLVGSGDGTVHGPEVNGTIRWSNFETQGEWLCGMYPAGVIETTDGGTIRFEAKGYALRRVAQDSPTGWKVAGGMRFDTNGPRYGWLNEALGVWEGEFDEATGEATWRVYAPGAARAA